MKPIIGVFGTEKSLTNALDELYSRGFTKDEVQILRRPTGANFTKEDKEMTLIAGATRTTSNTPGAVPVTTRKSARAMREDLVKMGVPDDELDFYLQRLQHDNKLVILDVDEPRATKALDIMRKAQATNLN